MASGNEIVPLFSLEDCTIEGIDNEVILDEIERLRNREWDLLEQLSEARLIRAVLMNLLKDRNS